MAASKFEVGGVLPAKLTLEDMLLRLPPLLSDERKDDRKVLLDLESDIDMEVAAGLLDDDDDS